jgi:hypothetical protein
MPLYIICIIVDGADNMTRIDYHAFISYVVFATCGPKDFDDVIK